MIVCRVFLENKCTIARELHSFHGRKINDQTYVRLNYCCKIITADTSCFVRSAFYGPNCGTADQNMLPIFVSVSRHGRQGSLNYMIFFSNVPEHEFVRVRGTRFCSTEIRRCVRTFSIFSKRTSS